MSLEHIHTEILKQLDEKDVIFMQLLNETKQILDDILKVSPIDIHSVSVYLPKGIIGRRLPDKIIHLKTILDRSTEDKSYHFEAFKNLSESILNIIEHLKIHKEYYGFTLDFPPPPSLDELRKRFQTISSLETEFHHGYARKCKERLGRKYRMTKTIEEKNEIKETASILDTMVKHLPARFMLKIKNVNEEYNDVLTFKTMEKEYDKILNSANSNLEKKKILENERDFLRKAAKLLTDLKKNQAQALSYTSQIEKLETKIRFSSENSSAQLEELSDSYIEGRNLVEGKIKAINNSLTELNILNEESYTSLFKENQLNFAAIQIEISKFDRLASSFEEILNEVDSIRKLFESQSTSKNSEN